MTLQKVAFLDMVNTTDSRPWRFMLVGGVGAGKTTLLQALESRSTDLVGKTQMIDYAGWGIDTPGEFSELGHLRRSLVSTAFDAQLLVVVQDATREESIFPPHYFLMFPQHIIGVVTKMDDKEADAERAKTHLAEAGVTGEIFCVSATADEGISELRAYLLDANL